MSARELEDHIQSYECLLDRLLAANNSERSDLLAAYADSRRKKTGSNTSLNGLLDNHSSVVNGTFGKSGKLNTSSNKDQDTTLTVLGCGVFASRLMCSGPPTNPLYH